MKNNIDTDHWMGWLRGWAGEGRGTGLPAVYCVVGWMSLDTAIRRQLRDNSPEEIKEYLSVEFGKGKGALWPSTSTNYEYAIERLELISEGKLCECIHPKGAGVCKDCGGKI